MATAELSRPAAEKLATPPPAEERLLLTAADLEHFPDELPSGVYDYELFDGVLVMMNSPTARHGRLQARLTGELLNQGERLGHGNVYTEIGLLMQRNPDRVLRPDISFYVRGILPLTESPEGYMETMPSLVVEIRSKNDSRAYVERKVQGYLEAAVPLVWVVDSDTRSVLIFRPGKPLETLGDAQTLTAEGVLPDFRLPLTELFRE